MIVLHCDDKAFLASFDAVLRMLERMDALPESRSNEYMDAVGALFGQNMFFDTYAMLWKDHSGQLEECRWTLRQTRAGIEKYGTLSWIFKLLLQAVQSLAGLDDKLPANGESDAADDDDMQTSLLYEIDVCRFAAHVLLTWCSDDNDGQSVRQMSQLLLSMQVEEALNLLLPSAHVEFDAADVEDVARELESLQASRIAASVGEKPQPFVGSFGGNASDDVSDEAANAAAPSAPPEPPAPPMPMLNMGEHALCTDQSEAYVQNSRMVQRAIAYQWAQRHPDNAAALGLELSEAAVVSFPWNDRSFTFARLVQLVGYSTAESQIDKPLLLGDADEVREGLDLLAGYGETVRLEGLPALPLHVNNGLIEQYEPLCRAAFAKDDLDAAYSYTQVIRTVMSDMACVLLSWMNDDNTIPLALAALDQDMETYAERLNRMAERN